MAQKGTETCSQIIIYMQWCWIENLTVYLLIWKRGRVVGHQVMLVPVMMIGYMFFVCLFVRSWRNCPPPQWARASSIRKFINHTQRRTTFGRTPLDEWSARRIDLYLTTHNTHNRQTFMPPVGFEPTISAGQRPQTSALDSAANGIGSWLNFRHRAPSI